jgi:selenoprotein W-related protein
LLNHFEPEIEALTLIPSDGGRFEVTINGDLLYSKTSSRRHAEPGEVVQLVSRYLQKGTR